MHDSPARSKLGRWGPCAAAAAAALAAAVAGAVSDAVAAYPGSNGKIAFETGRLGVNIDIFSMNPDGSGLARLTEDPSDDRDPVWSPVGSKIVWARRGAHFDVWKMNADGSGETNLTPGAAGSGPPPCTSSNGKGGDNPTWSPNGRKIAYMSGADIFVMKANGKGKKNLTCTDGTEGAERDPAWSPGGKIAFVRGLNGNLDIWKMNADGSGQVQLTTDTAAEVFPDWSPDSSRIVYQKGASQIWVMNADGSDKMLLTGDDVGEGGSNPAWSPDGTKIVFASNAFDSQNGYDLFTMNPDGTGVTRIPSPPESDLDPNWQPLPGT